ncbi:signal recognition particle-docking protein FtsY [Hyphococcus luteus]|uniref:signal recognition particle-docking protein FtsY n=1 Tax=Hyphococcus luteus TaxID=2058213 RepID=UPI0013FD59CC|nr:signal recognition particle-docking protein FtsY [Marinicaulis flavus]
MANKFLSGLFGKKKPEEEEAAPPPEEAEALEEAETSEDLAPEAPAEEAAPDSVAVAPEPPPKPESEPEPEPEAKPEKKKGWLSRLRDGLSKSSSKLTEGVAAIFTKRKLDDEMLEELTDLLITADLGVPAATRITEALAGEKYDKDITAEEVRAALAKEVAATLAPLEQPLVIDGAKKPQVLLMVGVNGAGKTTTIGKLAKKFADEGKSVMLAAGDTFRAAAIEQLQVWGERTGAPVVSRPTGADAAGLAFDAVKEAQEKGADILMIDTAGRLQNRKELMEELAKIVRVVKKLDETAPHNVILTLDATVGQNAISQAKVFTEIAGVTGLVMTKLDGTARGGVLVALADKFKLPIHFIGVGEGVEDLQEFNAGEFAAALAGVADTAVPENEKA